MGSEPLATLVGFPQHLPEALHQALQLLENTPIAIAAQLELLERMSGLLIAARDRIRSRRESG